MENTNKDLRLESLIEKLEAKGILTDEEALSINEKGHGVKFKEIRKSRNAVNK